MTYFAAMSRVDNSLTTLLRNVSVEVTPVDTTSIEAASKVLPAQTEVFIACPRSVGSKPIISAAVRLREANMIPVAHLPARNLSDEFELTSLLERLSGEAEVTRVLVVGGDRDVPAGPYDCGLQIIRAGLLERYGIRTVYLPCYPEDHPRIETAKLEASRREKLAVARNAGFQIGFISQFCFEPEPIIALAKRLRGHGPVPYRVGVVGPVSHGKLLKYALMCGVGPSIRALRERRNLAKNMLSRENPEQLLREIAIAKATDATLGISGIHFFTFGALAASADFINRMTGIQKSEVK
jgi:methylenetetrahydrofolate reductase (NADPH)